MPSSKGTNLNRINSQFHWGIIFFFILLAVGLLLSTHSRLISIYWLTGIALGYILQRSRFCFTAATRDPFLTGSTTITRAVLIGLGLTTIGFAGIKFFFATWGLPIPGQEYIQGIGLSTIVGGVFFGIGTVLASGCASGMLMRIGEGYHLQIITLIFFFIGSILGNIHLEWWNQNFVLIPEGIFLPDVFGWLGALGIQLAVIVGLYVLAVKWEEKHDD
ncbi:YeeE/YedE thiosulfate transporter family protein [Acetobacterium bakii]|uniref:Transporter n=1 Tax=Acetobacterium bakii TaxID=52689 RepID=A0A0L6U6I7_9FIRM|nr:YeeE/YedE thiosulfate transporter family protein [Acetobacterium bakii]KNZ43390.1 transporter [Acetobacterium bakii]